MTPARLAARCVELLDDLDGPIAVVAPPNLTKALAARVQIAAEDAPASGAVCSFLHERLHPHARGERLNALAARLQAGAPIIVVDHNRPRRVPARLANAVGLLLRGMRPSRAAYATARELQRHRFVVHCLRLAATERIQLVVAHRATRNPRSDV